MAEQPVNLFKRSDVSTSSANYLLFPKTKASLVGLKTNFSYESGAYTAATGAPYVDTTRVRSVSTSKARVEPDSHYTVVCTVPPTDNRTANMSTAYYDKDGNFIQNIENVYNVTSGLPQIISTPSNAYYMNIYFYAPTGGVSPSVSWIEDRQFEWSPSIRMADSTLEEKIQDQANENIPNNGRTWKNIMSGTMGSTSADKIRPHIFSCGRFIGIISQTYNTTIGTALKTLQYSNNSGKTWQVWSDFNTTSNARILGAADYMMDGQTILVTVAVNPNNGVFTRKSITKSGSIVDRTISSISNTYPIVYMEYIDGLLYVIDAGGMVWTNQGTGTTWNNYNTTVTNASTNPITRVVYSRAMSCFVAIRQNGTVMSSQANDPTLGWGVSSIPNTNARVATDICVGKNCVLTLNQDQTISAFHGFPSGVEQLFTGATLPTSINTNETWMRIHAVKNDIILTSNYNSNAVLRNACRWADNSSTGVTPSLSEWEVQWGNTSNENNKIENIDLYNYRNLIYRNYVRTSDLYGYYWTQYTYNSPYIPKE